MARQRTTAYYGCDRQGRPYVMIFTERVVMGVPLAGSGRVLGATSFAHARSLAMSSGADHIEAM